MDAAADRRVRADEQDRRILEMPVPRFGELMRLAPAREALAGRHSLPLVEDDRRAGVIRSFVVETCGEVWAPRDPDEMACDRDRRRRSGDGVSCRRRQIDSARRRTPRPSVLCRGLSSLGLCKAVVTANRERSDRGGCRHLAERHPRLDPDELGAVVIEMANGLAAVARVDHRHFSRRHPRTISAHVR